MSNFDFSDVSKDYPWLGRHWSFFIQQLESDRLAHALLIEGPMGCGKEALARAMAARLLCRGDMPLACGQCRSCRLLPGGAHPDFFELRPEEGSEIIKVDQVRSLIGRLDLTTSISARKVAYLQPAESMNISAANALLKSLEEPAGETVLILVSHDAGRLPVTIRSRCQKISVGQPDRQLVLEWLGKKFTKPGDELSAALQAAGGSPLRAVHYLDSPELDAYGQVRKALALLLAKPASVSQVCQQLGDLKPTDLWRWLSICAGEVIRSGMTDLPLSWMPVSMNLNIKTLLQLQRQADINRQLSATPLRGDLLLQDWLIKWAEQII